MGIVTSAISLLMIFHASTRVTLVPWPLVHLTGRRWVDDRSLTPLCVFYGSGDSCGVAIKRVGRNVSCLCTAYGQDFTLPFLSLLYWWLQLK
jgi:hypothetical protein